MPIASSVLEPLSRFAGTVVCVGGTSGIGRAIAFQIAQNTKHKCDIVIVGRNKSAADDAFARMRETQQAEHSYSFYACDVTTLANVRTLSAELRKTFEKVNYLVLSCGFITIKGRSENNTTEQVDKKMAVNFYARQLFVQELLPLLQKAKEVSGDARVLNVLDSIHSVGKIDWNDLELKTTWGPVKCARQTTTFTNLIHEDYALRHPSIGFSHAYPGIVNTGAAAGYPFPLNWFGGALLRVMGIPADLCAERMLKALFDPRFATGDWRLDDKAEPTSQAKTETGEEARIKLREHVEEVFKRGVAP